MIKSPPLTLTAYYNQAAAVAAKHLQLRLEAVTLHGAPRRHKGRMPGAVLWVQQVTRVTL